ncbi:hypothetical protein BX070DRAFT_258124 [Coemansia spiralis]|nr:hypothetical protein BX070DRAFT_258124 [Coemansia spiralis]
MTVDIQERQAGTGTANTCLEDSEITPLLNSSPSETDLEIIKNGSAEPYINVAKGELRWMATATSLTTLTMLLQFSFIVVNVVAVGHLGAKKLAGMSLAGASQGLFIFGPLYGLLSAMDTFCSNAYTASRDKTLVGFHFQRGVIAVCTQFALTLPILWNFENFLLLIGQDPGIAQLTGKYLRIQILGLIPHAI